MTSNKPARLSTGTVRNVLLILVLLGISPGIFAQTNDVTQESIEISLQGGQIKTIPIDLGSDSRPDLKLWARLEPLPEEWPEKDLRIEIISDEIDYKPEGRTLVVQVTAEHCCHAGEYNAKLTIGAGKPESPHGKVATLSLKVRVARGPICTAANFGIGGLLLLGALLWLYTRGMYFNCSFLSPDRLADRLVPQRWTSQGQTEGMTGKKDEIRNRIAAQFRPFPRFRAWLLANPLVFGLPWKRYKETVAIDLGRRHDDILLSFMPYRETFRHCQSNPEDARGKMFASGQEAFIFCLPDRKGLIGRLRPDFLSDRVAEVRRGAKLLAASAGSMEDPKGLPAGWQILS
jgi:hypothetical protein